MAHEFVIKNGFITSGQSYVYQNLTVSGLTLSSVPANDDTLTQILARDSSGNVKYRTASSLAGGSGTFTGGTVTGPTNFTAGLTANTISATTISKVDYIDFNTGSTNPSQSGGRVFFDNTSKALSYYDIVNSLVPIAMGQQLYTRVWNATGAQIDKGKVIAITGTTNGLPSAILAVNTHEITSARPIGLAAENILNNSEGLVLNNGILSGITLNTFANGDTLYLSDTVPGGYISTTSSLAFTARTNEIGYVLQTGTTTGKIYVNINNEDSNLSLTDKERNILEGNVISSGVYEYTGMTQGTGATINVAYARGWIVRNTYGYSTLPDVTNVYYTGGTNIPLTYLNSADATYILINSGSTLYQQTTFPTPQQRRENILLGKVVHPNRSTITSINQTVDFDVSPMSAIRDLWTPLKLINQGVVVSANGVNMNINSSAGSLWGNGIGWTTNQQNPDSISMSGQSPVTFQYRTQLGILTGGTVATGNTTTINPAYYDLNGVVTAVGGGSNSSTNQRIYMFPTGLIRIQLGQQVYGSLSAAVAGAQTEQFVEYGNNRDNGILIGILSINKDASVGNGGLVNTSYAVFNFVSKFGEVLGGTGGISTTTLQQAYDNSSTPEIVINATLDGLSIKNGTGNPDGTTNLLEGINAAGTTTSFIRADGLISGSSLSVPNFTANSTGVSATTISATTYQGNIVTSISGGSNINVNQTTGDVTVTAVPSNNTTAIQFNDSGSFAGDDTTLAYILSQVVFVGGSASYTVGGAVTNSSIIGGESNSLSDNINRSVIIGGRSSLVRGNSTNSAIIGGDTNDIAGFNNTVILGGSNITATASDFVYVPSLNINTTPTNDDNLTQVLVRDNSGDVKYRNASSLGGGGSFTGGTVIGPTVFTNGLTSNTLTVTGTTLSLGDITGNTLVSSQSSGDEGGEIRLSKAQTNTTLSGTTITIDIYQNRLRFFETGSPNRGAYIDLTTASSGVGTNLLSGGGTFTGGTVSGGTNFIGGVTANTLVYSVVTLSSGATISVNAVLGNEFKVTLGGNSVLGNPTGAVDGQYLRFAIRQDATGNRNLTFDTNYRFGNEIGTPSVDLTANKTSYLGVRYNSADDKFDVISFVSGY